MFILYIWMWVLFSSVYCQELLESGSKFKDALHDGKFVIYDDVDRQMVESGVDEITSNSDHSPSFYEPNASFNTNVEIVPDLYAKDSSLIASFPMNSFNKEHDTKYNGYNHVALSDSEFGYRLRNNHQLQSKKPRKVTKVKESISNGFPTVKQEKKRKDESGSNKLIHTYASYYDKNIPMAESYPAPVHVASDINFHSQRERPIENYKYQVKTTENNYYPKASEEKYPKFGDNKNKYDALDAAESSQVPESTKVAIENHPELTEQQRDSLLKILQSYYQLIHKFNIDFTKLVSESKSKQKQSKPGTIVIEPVAQESKLIPSQSSPPTNKKRTCRWHQYFHRL